MNESEYKRDLVKALKRELPGCVVFKHSDRNAGVPDLSVTWSGFTTWIEVKLAKPGIDSRELQEIMMQRLALRGRAVYVIYVTEGDVRTILVYPEDISDWRTRPRHETSGICHALVAAYLRGDLDQ